MDGAGAIITTTTTTIITIMAGDKAGALTTIITTTTITITTIIGSLDRNRLTQGSLADQSSERVRAAPWMWR